MSRRADVIDIVSIDQYVVLFSFQAHIGSCIILLATEEGHVTISDQRNMGPIPKVGLLLRRCSGTGA